MEENKSKKPSYVMTAEDVLNLGVKEVPMLFAPILEKVGVGVLCGSSDGGKSFLCLNLGLALCSDDDQVLGLKIHKSHSSVIMVATEDTPESTCVRLTGLLEERDMKQSNLRFIYETENIEAKLRHELTRQPADLVIVDTFGDLFTGNLNQSIDVRRFFKPYKQLAKDFKCLILFNHHIGKGKEANASPNKSDVLGSQGIESSCRTVLMLRKETDNKRVLTVVKGNNIPDKLKNQGMVLEFSPKNGFTNTGAVKAYAADAEELLASEAELISLVLELYPVHSSYQKVAAALREQGHKVDKNRVGKIWKENCPSGILPEKKDDGQEEQEQEQEDLGNEGSVAA